MTPEGVPLSGAALDADVGRRCGKRVELMELKHGIFDEASVSVMATATVREVCRLAGRATPKSRSRCATCAARC